MEGSEEACLNNFLGESGEGECPITQGPSVTSLTGDRGGLTLLKLCFTQIREVLSVSVAAQRFLL